MRNTLYFALIALLLISCCKDEIPPEATSISRFAVYNESGSLLNEYRFYYNENRQAAIRVYPITYDSINYVGDYVSECYTATGFEEKRERYYYSQDRLDSIKTEYEATYTGIDLMVFSWEQEKCISKTEIRNNEIINIYNFIYKNDRIEEIILEQIEQNDTLHYIYKYDEFDNIAMVLLNGIIHAAFEYTNYKNPLYFVSKPYLIKAPVHPNLGEQESITSEYLYSKANYYSWEGNITTSYTLEYTLNDYGLPVSAKRTVNGDKQMVYYEYQ